MESLLEQQVDELDDDSLRKLAALRGNDVPADAKRDALLETARAAQLDAKAACRNGARWVT